MVEWNQNPGWGGLTYPRHRLLTLVSSLPLISLNIDTLLGEITLLYTRNSCSKCERQGHNLFYVENTAQVRGGLRGTLGEEYRADLVGVLVLNYSKTGGR